MFHVSLNHTGQPARGEHVRFGIFINFGKEMAANAVIRIVVAKVVNRAPIFGACNGWWSDELATRRIETARWAERREGQ
jgi:hypothetical protein